MYSGHTLVLVLTASLILIPVIVAFGNSDYHEQARRKLVTDIPGFISIDCGAAGDHYDEDTGFIYKSDEEYIDTGMIMPISSKSNPVNLRQELKNLRSFPQGTKNCYTLKPEHGKNNKYMIRAFFNYGNYDGKNQPPVFDLYLGVNKWDTVEVGDDSSTIKFKEIIHFSLTDNIYVCLVNTGSGIPFISALELRLLDISIYKTDSGALQTIGRYDVGGSNYTRYPSDIYDRIWTPRKLLEPQRSSDWYPISIQSTIDIQSSNAAYHLPEEVLETAAQTHSSRTPLIFSWNSPDATSECYVYFHFAEIEVHQGGQLRELILLYNGEYNLIEPIKLEYLKPLTIGLLNLPFNGSQLNFSIYATKESNLPPILNAFEIFVVKNVSDSPTNLEDVDAIMDIKKVYGVTRNWQGDPCVPSNYLWDGLNCSYNNYPRIISLNLASSRLTGKIASSLSNLKSLESLDLSNNNLIGPVPEFLAQLPSLKTLNLAGNKLSCPIPQAVMEKVNEGSLHLSWDENPNLCSPYSPEPKNKKKKKKKKKKKFIVQVGESIGAVLVLFLLSSLFFWYSRREKQGESNKEGSLKSKNQEFTYSEVVSITDNFKTIIGKGGFGKVYLGTLKNGNQVAVKLHSLSSEQGPKEFRTEAQLLIRVHHRNLVSLIGYCNDGTHMALIYEYMTNGDLKHHLSETNANVLNWQKRLQIAVDAAQGLDYLHNGCKPPIIHMDMKTSNILLNERLQAKIADFGLSRGFKNESDTHVSIGFAGTFGYMDPVSYTTGMLSKKSDIYSFGVILLELITGREAIIKDDPEMHIHVSEWAKLEGWDIRKIVDQKFPGDFSPNSVQKAVDLAMSCIESTAIKRPDMNNVLEELKECLTIEMAPEGTWRMVSTE